MKNRRKESVLILVALFFLSACSQLTTRHDVTTAPGGKGPTRINKEIDDFSDKINEVEVPVPTVPPEATEEKRVAVILGPGGYKAFSHAGVLKELIKKNIPIQEIVGIEWGALVAALYAQRGQINEAEWKLYKLEKLDLSNAGFFGRKNEPQSINVLDSFLRDNLDAKIANKTAVPFFCPSLSLARGTIQWPNDYPLYQAVKMCLPYPPLFQPDNQMVAGLFSLEEIIYELKKNNYNVIILVNVLGDGGLIENQKTKNDYAASILWQEVRRSIWRAKSMVTDVIEVNTRGVSMLDFDSRKLLVTAGEAAGEKAASELVSKYGF
ncbi:MAG: hypothetical protein A2Z20_00745 [Bdellovibrionales bacterium RBG_16_40_8]|nr:MAG: hypothetical protein A2Z20_00745 [Bdellovibrionales bacterium RBG_16_40_8]